MVMRVCPGDPFLQTSFFGFVLLGNLASSFVGVECSFQMWRRLNVSTAKAADTKKGGTVSKPQRGFRGKGKQRSRREKPGPTKANPARSKPPKAATQAPIRAEATATATKTELRAAVAVNTQRLTNPNHTPASPWPPPSPKPKPREQQPSAATQAAEPSTIKDSKKTKKHKTQQKKSEKYRTEKKSRRDHVPRQPW